MSEETIPFRVLRDSSEQAAVFDWWARLSGHDTTYGGEQLSSFWSPATRAMLRRVREPEDALLSEGFRYLWFNLPESQRKPWLMPTWGCIASVLAEVREHDSGVAFAASMGREVEQGAGKPRVSELRFSQLQHSKDLGELHRRLRRMVHLLRKRVNVVSIADDILHWHRERAGAVDPHPDRRLAVRWATAYFTELARYQKPAANQ